MKTESLRVCKCVLVVLFLVFSVFACAPASLAFDADEGKGGFAAARASSTCASYADGEKKAVRPFSALEQIEEGMTLVASSIEAKAGEEIEIAISVQNNTGLAGYILGLDFDNAVLEYIGLQQSKLTADISAVSMSKLFELENDVRRLSVMWAGIREVKENGVLYTARFRVRETAQGGVYPIALSYVYGDIINESYEKLTPGVIGGNLRVPLAKATYLRFLEGCRLSVSRKMGFLPLRVSTDAEKVVFRTSGEAIATVDESGLLTLKNCGVVAVFAETKGENNLRACLILTVLP